MSGGVGSRPGTALVAVVGTQFLGWERGDGRLVPTIIGGVAAAIAVVAALTCRE